MDVSGAFRHKKCDRLSVSMLPFPNLTCPMCALAPLKNDFRMFVRKGEEAMIKRGYCSTASGIRLEYLSTIDVSQHTQSLVKKYKLE